MDFDQVLPNIFVGSHPRSNEDIDTLKAVEISAVLNLQTDEDFRRLNVDWNSLDAHYWALGIGVRRVPIRDFDANDLRGKLPQAVEALDELVKARQTVYVHCSGGVNRSPSTIIAYLCWIERWSLQDAADHVQKQHSCDPVMEAIRGAIWDRRRA
jgi:protein-tyrosine phosphatase